MAYKYKRSLSIQENTILTDIKSAYLPGKVVNGFNTSRLYFIQNDIMKILIQAFACAHQFAPMTTQFAVFIPQTLRRLRNDLLNSKFGSQKSVLL